MSNLVSPSDVADVTGKSVSATDIATAQSVIETATGYDLADRSDYLTKRDARLIRAAIIWQTAYLVDNPALLTQQGNLTAASTNGVSVTFGEGGNAESLIAPLAQMNLSRLSWRRSRAIHLSSTLRTMPFRQTLVDDGNDADWTPMTGGRQR